MSLTKDDLQQIKEVVKEVVQGDLKGLRSDFLGLKGEFGDLRGEFREFKNEVSSEFRAFRSEVRIEFKAVRGEINDLRTEVREMGDDVDHIYNDLQDTKSAVNRQHENHAAFVITTNDQFQEVLTELGYYAQKSATKEELKALDKRVNFLELQAS